MDGHGLVGGSLDANVGRKFGRCGSCYAGRVEMRGQLEWCLQRRRQKCNVCLGRLTSASVCRVIG